MPPSRPSLQKKIFAAILKAGATATQKGTSVFTDTAIAAKLAAELAKAIDEYVNKIGK
tara:strand:+ start:681 stop:854 length:174 start_codon:yes stop_codon:yes gene_type:complete